jgi:hypothetical protein
MLTREEKTFHTKRIAFVIIDNMIHYLTKSELGHKEWLVDSGWMTQEQFDTLVRGYIQDNKFYFYKGDFITDMDVEFTAGRYLSQICSYLDIPIPDTVFCGVEKGKVGQPWKPIKTLRIY